jgi:hypothetical protein
MFAPFPGDVNPIRNGAPMCVFDASVFGREHILPYLHPRGVFRRGPVVRYVEFGLLGTVVHSVESRLFDCVVGPPAYERGNLVLLERVSSPTPLISVEIDDECVGPVCHGGGVVGQLHGGAYLVLVL